MRTFVSETRLVDPADAQLGQFVRPTTRGWPTTFNLGVVISDQDSEKAILALDGSEAFRWFAVSRGDPEHFIQVPTGELEIETPDACEHDPNYQALGALLLRTVGPLICVAPAGTRYIPRPYYVNLETWAVEPLKSGETFQAFQNWRLLARRRESDISLIAAGSA